MKKRQKSFLVKLLPFLVLIGLTVMVVLLTQAIGQKKAELSEVKKKALAAGRPVANAMALRLSPSSLSDRLNLPGVIEPWEDLTLLAQVTGTLSRVDIKEGERVQKGQVLAMIEEDDYRIQLERAGAAYKLAKSENERNKKLLDKGVLPIAEYDRSLTRLQTSKADLDNAALQLKRCTITSPLSGVVQKLDAKVGLLVSRGDILAQILEIDRLKGVIGIPESDVDAVRRLDRIELAIQALDNLHLTAIPFFLAPSPKKTARLYRLEVAIDNSDNRILPGMFFRAEMIKHEKENVVVVPLYSVINRDNHQYVFVNDKNIARRKEVKTGIIQGWLVEITDGLLPGEEVLVEGHRTVEAGQQIKVLQTISDPTEAGS